MERLLAQHVVARRSLFTYRESVSKFQPSHKVFPKLYEISLLESVAHYSKHRRTSHTRLSPSYISAEAGHQFVSPCKAQSICQSENSRACTPLAQILYAHLTVSNSHPSTLKTSRSLESGKYVTTLLPVITNCPALIWVPRSFR